MYTVGCAAPGLYVIADRDGWGSVLHLREHEVVLFNPHRVPDDLLAACVPCGPRSQALLRLVDLVTRHGAPAGPSEPGILRLDLRLLPESGSAIVAYLAVR